MRFISYLLNLPSSIMGLSNLLLCVPTEVELRKDAVVFYTRTCGLVHLFAPKARGFAAGNIVVVKKGESENIVQHELVHVEQHMRRPFIFPLLYAWQLRKGYWNNKYEIEAYDRTNTWPGGKKQKAAE